MAQPHENELLEKVFEHITQGKKLKTEGNLWGAAESFLEARSLLLQLASDCPTDSEELLRIAELYQTQCREYFHRTRASLIQAMQDEHQKDVQKQAEPPNDDSNDTTDRNYGYQTLSNEEASKRVLLFSTVFAKEISTPPQPVVVAVEGAKEIATATPQPVEATENGEDSKDENNKNVMSLEERLMELNANLPKGFKTPKERLQDINQGMKRLGMSVYNDGNNTNNPLKIEPPKPASQQVEDIIAQAKDEVAMGLVPQDDDNDGASATSNVDDIISDDDYLSDDDGADSLLSDEVPELQNVAQIQDQVATAQAKLAELTALLDTLPSPEELEEAEVQGDSKDDSPPFENAYAKQMLTDAKQAVGKALKLWKLKPRS